MENKEKKEIKNTESKYSKVKKITIPDDSSIPVTSLFCGKLTYVSKKDGSTYEWNEFGETGIKTQVFERIAQAYCYQEKGYTQQPTKINQLFGRPSDIAL